MSYFGCVLRRMALILFVGWETSSQPCLPVFKRDFLYTRDMRFDVFFCEGRVDPFFAGGVVSQPERFAFSQILFRTDRARRKSAAACWADIYQNSVDAAGATGTFIRTNPSLQRVVWQVTITPFAIGADF